MRAAKACLVTLAIALSIACANSGSETARTLPSVTSSPVSHSAAPENFARHCLGCHGERGEAGTVQVNNKTLRVPSLIKGHAVEHTDEQLAKQISEGDDEMPAFKDKLTADEINGLVRHIRSEFQGK